MDVRRAGYAVVVMALLVLGWASMALACTVQPQVRYSLLPESATPGSTVMVEGKNVATQSPVEIRWNGVGGKVLASATPLNGAFSVPVQVPEAEPGIYSLMLVTEKAGVGRTAFEVIAPAADGPATRPAAQLWPRPPEGPVPTDGVGNAALVGVGLLAVGIVGLFAGSTAVVAYRRRAMAEVRR
jgi:hypothetical protein